MTGEGTEGIILIKKTKSLEFEKGGSSMGTEKERKDTQKALLYDLRLIFSNGEKETYTKTEIVELLDKIAMAKDQE